MLAISGKLIFRPEEHDDIAEGLRGIIKLSRREPGCVEYWFAGDLDQPGTFAFFECWADKDAFDTHVASSNQKEFGERYLSRMTGAIAAQYEISDRQIIAGEGATSSS
jgi:quinol monooxygenase YgiN